jgi:hypothetical protein
LLDLLIARSRWVQLIPAGFCSARAPRMPALGMVTHRGRLMPRLFGCRVAGSCDRTGSENRQADCG